MTRMIWIWIWMLLYTTISLFAAETGYENNFALTRGQVGVLQLGMKADTLYHFFNIDQLEVEDLQIEGVGTPALKIFYGETEIPTLIAEVMQKHDLIINKIHVLDQRFRLNSNLGIGSTLGELRAKHQVTWIHYCDRGHFCAHVADLVMTFKLDLRTPPDEWLKTEDPATIPDSARVIEIFVESKLD